MNDATLAVLWAVVFAGGLGCCAALHRGGMPTTRVRDLLHVGAGIWALGWPAWHHAAVPCAIATAGLLALAALPTLSRRIGWLEPLRRGVSDQEEQWSGLVLYAAAACALTALAMAGHPFEAGAGFWALALGDGIGGALGKAFGRHRFQLPWAKQKSLEGSLAVALLSGIGIVLAGRYFGHSPRFEWIVIAAIAAAAAEAIAPRASDNLLVPAVVAAVLGAASG